MMAEKMIITIGREYGSCGLKIGKMLSERLNIPYYDNEIIEMAAKKSGYDEELFKSVDEKQTTSLLFSIAMGVFSYGDKLKPQESLNLSDKLFNIEKKIVEEVAEKGSCIIIGRCSNYILRDKEDTLDLFICSALENRIKTISENSGVSMEEAEKYIKSIDKKRSGYYNYYTGEQWGDRKSYDIIINKDILGIEGTVSFIEELAERKYNK